MKQKEIDIMMEKIDRKKLPKHWNEFINKQTKDFHYIIKDVKKKECYCTNCQHTFYDTKVRIKEYFKCPNCKKKISVVSKNVYIQSFQKSINLVQRINKNIITRVFEIETFYNATTKKMENIVDEYCRIIPGKGKFLSDIVWFFLGNMSICHYYECNNTNWRKYDGIRNFTDFETYPFNQNKIIRNTKFQYAPIKEFTKMFYKYNFIDAIELAAYESFEMLWNMKLYNLCFDSKKLNKKGSFYKRFGITKDYLKFMQDNNLDYTELKLLKLFKKKDMNLITECYNKNFNDIKYLYEKGILDAFLQSNNYIYSSNIKILKEISEYIPLYKLNKYQKGMKNLNIYKDYLVMSKKLALNYVSNKDLYPRNLIARHNKIKKQLEIEKDRNTQFAAYLRYLELSKYTYEDEKYIIFPATSVEAIKDEGIQQRNCVGRLYLHPYIEKETEIFFVRKLKNITKSFITLEYKNGFVKQKELPFRSRNFEKEHNEFIDKWLGYRSFIDNKEKYKIKTKIKKYDLTKIVA